MKIPQIKTVYAFLAAIVLASAHQASAITVNEIGDAGQTRATGQDVSHGNALLTAISGGLDTGQNDVDFFRIHISNGSGFSAGITSGTDPMLFLWDLSGSPIAFNDDYFGLQSYINPVVANGYYWLGISRFSNGYGMHSSDTGFSSGSPSAGGSAYTINLTGVSGGYAAAASVPDGGSSVALLGLAMSGVVWLRRKMK